MQPVAKMFKMLIDEGWNDRGKGRITTDFPFL